MLSILIWLPAAAALAGALLPRRLAWPGAIRRRDGMAGVLALGGSLASLGLSIALIARYDGGSSGLRHVTDTPWIAALGIHYKLGVDGLNVFLIGLTTLLFSAALLASNLRQWERPRLFFFQ